MLRVGIIGTGGISAAHINGYLEFGDRCEIVGLCDIVPAKAEARKEEFGLTGARVYDDAGAMLAAEDLDLVSIATPPNTHAPLAIQALQAGVNALVEKPMAPSLEECDAMLAAAEASGKLLSVVAQNRFRDDMATLKEALESGLLGTLSHAQINSVWSRSLPYYDLWWRGTWASEGGGCTLNHAIHHLDLTLWLLGRPNAVTAVLSNAQHDNAEVEDLSVAILAYDRALAEVTSSVVHHGEDQQSIIIQGQHARVAQPWHAAADAHRPNGFPSGPNTDLVEKLDALAEAHEPLPHTRHAGQIGDVLAALAEGREPAITAADGRNSIELVTAIYESGIERRTVDLPIPPEDPYYCSGTLVERAPHFYEKSASVSDLDGEITVGATQS
ncbi:Gfo/Idh/MocA family oxidoreductase [Propioniciclava coleopterorum]|uniref:Gfo/Idh/MocA family oxidoreductase n=1 Tax=Propioniciclava coleopterorum TaxID=2714937 RepID=A0A6G7Y7J3_9ACTN|nr:Gfo/Idh/MocA family oxidoreductase [Propioniciclava coleopterorum]QIK72618.1 Gfo/Idh/MocA family oxidoreductase [Propioniciclava coleopterorum]